MISRMNIAQRFLASVCLFSLPLGVLFYFDMAQVSQQMDFARKELYGNRFQAPAIRMLAALSDYQTAALVGADVTAIDTARKHVDDLMTTLQKANGDFGGKLGFSDQDLKDAGLESDGFNEIKSKWDALRNGPRDSPPAKSERYEQLVSDLRGWIGHAGDTSNLTLDPEMDSYYLADVTSVSIAQTLNRIGSTMILVEPAMKSGRATDSDRRSLAIANALLKESDFDRITGDLDTAFKENAKSSRGPSPSLKIDIEPALATYKADVTAYLSLLSSGGQGKVASPAEFHLLAARANRSSLQLWEKTLPELDIILGQRIQHLSKYRRLIVLGTLLSLVFAIGVLTLSLRGIIRPLGVAVAYAGHVAGGDLSRQLPQEYLVRADEIGTLARAMQEMSAGLQQTVREISGGVGVLTSSASLLQASSSHMTSESNEASERAHSVAAASEQMSSNVASVAIRMEQTTTNLANVAKATGQMTATIGDIAGNSEKARRITEEAGVQATRITAQITQLSEAAVEIGKITEAISEISAQTNLLALNATIEAARAGAAGKGFAVVATEIKALAQQTAAATDDIKRRVAGVQTSTVAGVSEIQKVSQIIHQVTGIVGSIAAAIEEQALDTQHIAHNMSEASAAMSDSNEKVGQSSQVSKEIAKDISSLDRVASGIVSDSAHLRSGADEVSRISDQLTLTVNRFRLE
jgi:methyl-accepting chemotaxis protein